MKTWRTIAAAIAAFSLAAAIGCSADTGKDEDNHKPEPAVQDERQTGTEGTSAPANEGGSGEGQGDGQGVGQGADPSTDAVGGSGPGDHQIDLPMPVDPSEPQTDNRAGVESGNEEDGSMTILPIVEPTTEVEKIPGVGNALPEPVDPGMTPPDGNASNQGGGVDPNTTVEHRASIGGSDSAAGTGASAPADYGDGREPAPVTQAMPVPRSGR